ncbi:MAG: uroporphyrinogen-III C-methyltransferase [Ilumatobacteraceae bacterium]
MTVHLVGAGPGDPELLTVKAARLVASADVIVHDRLADATILDLARPDAERIDVGKRPGSPVAQDLINALLVHLGSQGLEVVRLKGGDPYVFGRGGEEADALAAAGIACDVVPGISSSVAAPAAAGIPVTHRGLSASFTVVTGHRERGGSSDVAWEALAAVGGTIVVLMGVAERGHIARRLMDGGLPADTPVAAVRWGTRPDQQAVRTTLEHLAATHLESPATIVIGAVAALDLQAPLHGARRHDAPMHHAAVPASPAHP